MLVADIAQPKSNRNLLLAHAAEIGSADFVVYRSYMLDSAFYLDHPIIVVEAGEDLQYGASLVPRPDLMISHAELIERLRDNRSIYLLTRAQDLPSLAEVPLRELGRQGPVVLVTNVR